MTKEKKGLTRRDFLELSAAGGAALTLGGPSAFAATPKRGGTFTVCIGLLMQTPDPQRYGGGWARPHNALLYEGLTTPTSRAKRLRAMKEKRSVGDVQPMLADSWEIEKGGQRYVFHIKKGVKFHNGKELDSGDVKWSWERIKDPIHRCHARKLLTLFLESAEAPDRYTVVANLSRPYGGFLMANAWCNAPILPKGIIPQGAIWGETPSFKPPTPGPPGTGPFVLTKHQQKYEAHYTAFKDYRIPGLPYLDKVISKVISKDSPRTMAFRAGNIDYIRGIEPKWLAKVMKGKELYKPIHLEKEGLVIYSSVGVMAPHTIYLNSHPTLGNSPFKDVKVRQAFDFCLDREKLARALYGDLAYPIGQPFNPDAAPWGFKDLTYRKRDIEKAKKLLKEAGYPNGLDVVFRFTPTWGFQDLVAQIVQQMTKPAGFRMKLVPEIGVQYWLHLRKRDYHMQFYHMGKEDPMDFVYPWLHTDPAKPWDGFAPCGVKEPDLDKMLDDMAAESDFVKRKAIFKKIIQRFQDQAYLIPLLSPVGASGWTDKLKNFNPEEYFHPFEAFREAWLEG